MTTERLEVRIDSELRRKLDELAKAEGSPASVLVREMIETAYEEALLTRRLEAVRRIAESELEDVPDMETLRRQLDEAHDPGVP